MTFSKFDSGQKTRQRGDAAKDAAPPVPGCEVVEYDEPTGQQEWSDSLFVQDFTDSVLATTPAALDIDQGNP